MPISTTELNRVTDEIVATDLTGQVHSADPGANGTTARIGTSTATAAAASWSAAVNGDTTYGADLEYGVIDSANNQTVTWISLWRGAAFVSRHALTAGITVVAGGTFKVNTGTIMINGATA